MHTLYRKPNLLFLIVVRAPTLDLITVIWQSLKRIPFERKLLRAFKIIEHTEISHSTYLYIHKATKLLHSFDDNPARVIKDAITKDYGGIAYHWYYGNKIHRDGDNPAYIYQYNNGSTRHRWFKNKYEHRDGDMPSYIVDGKYEDNQLVNFARIDYSKNGLLHREGNPAIIQSDGSQYWYMNGNHYRENNLPAVILPIPGGMRYEYYENGKMIRFENHIL